LAATLRREPGAEVEVVNGNKGELTVSVDGREVARKDGDKMPSADEVLAAMRHNKASVASAG